jgi:hypothetical protein
MIAISFDIALRNSRTILRQGISSVNLSIPSTTHSADKLNLYNLLIKKCANNKDYM